MKYSNLNFKNASYTEQHILYLGTHTGSLKSVDVAQQNPHSQANLGNLESLQKGSGVTTLQWMDSDILLGREDGTIKKYSTEKSAFTSSLKIDGKVMGLCAVNSSLVVAAEEQGNLIFLKNGKVKDSIQLCDNISRMRQHPNEPSKIAVGGKDRNNNLKLFDVSKKQIIFTTKNIPNDELDLEVPVWDTDIAFLQNDCVATCSRYGYVRIYDVKKQRRPVLKYKNDKEKISYTTMVAKDNMIYLGSNMGAIRAFDSRSLKSPVHTYKGFTGSVTSLVSDVAGRYLAAGGLDRYIRIYDAKSTVMIYQCYAKSKVTQLLMKEIKEEEEIKLNDGNYETSNNSTTFKRKTTTDFDPEYESLFNEMETVVEGTTDKSAAKKKKRNK